MSHLPPPDKARPPTLLSRYRPSLALLTDLYQLTMAEGYWKQQLAEREAVFHLHFRRNPFGGGYALCAGLEDLMSWVERFHFASEDLTYLSSLENERGGPLFDRGFLDHLASVRFTGQIDGIPEGRAVFPYEPLVRVQAPLLEAQLLETPLLTLINFPTLIATKAARLATAAQGEPVLEFGLRRAQGIDGGLTASRSAYIGGCDATSNMLAGQLFGIPVRGTHAHSWVMAFENELEAFEAFAKAHPDNTLLLVDTYDTLQGVHRAIEVAKKLRAEGHRFLGIRLDSGDLAYLSHQSRQLLDAAGFADAAIVASNELDELLITDLKRQGAKVAIWGVGTSLATGKGQSALDGVYKLSALRNERGEWVDKIKLSEQMVKVTNPGLLQVRRYSHRESYVADLLYDIRQEPARGSWMVDPFDPTRQKRIDPEWEEEELLIPLFRHGQPVYHSPPLREIRQRAQRELLRFHGSIKRFVYPHQYAVGMEQSLYEKKIALIRKLRGTAMAPL